MNEIGYKNGSTGRIDLSTFNGQFQTYSIRSAHIIIFPNDIRKNDFQKQNLRLELHPENPSSDKNEFFYIIGADYITQLVKDMRVEGVSELEGKQVQLSSRNCDTNSPYGKIIKIPEASP